jgi:hypothetical protein
VDQIAKVALFQVVIQASYVGKKHFAVGQYPHKTVG